MNFSKWNIDNCIDAQKSLQAILDQEGKNIGDRLTLLHKQQVEAGFVLDDLKEVQRFWIVNHANPEQKLLGQYNPRRADRGLGAGRKLPPQDVESVNGGCFLCRQNVIWQQRGLEMWYDFEVDNHPYVGMCNPFPLMSTHLTIASAEHEPQGWILGNKEENYAKIERIMNDLLRIASQMPGFIIFFNGRNAGASIEKHLHYQAIKRLPGQAPFPVEDAARSMIAKNCRAPFLIDGYPISTVYFNGNREDIRVQVVKCMSAWTDFCKHADNLSANIIGCLDAPASENSGKNTYHVYLVPRDTYFSASPGRQGVVGGLEVLGEIAFSYENEHVRIQNGLISYENAATILNAVEPRMVRAFFEQMKHSIKV
jgi:hypothetical protein